MILIQNYADYRYFSRFIKISTHLHWVPGSGGSVRNVGKDPTQITIVTRTKKYHEQEPDILRFLKRNNVYRKLLIIGPPVNVRFENLYKFIEVESKGFVAQSEILSFSKTFFAPYGYGEGIPHSLVDAVVSGCQITMSKRLYISCGFHKLYPMQKLSYDESYVSFVAHEQLRSSLCKKTVTMKTMKLIHQFINDSAIITGS